MSVKQSVSPQPKNIKTRENNCVGTRGLCSCESGLVGSAVQSGDVPVDVLPVVADADGEAHVDGGEELREGGHSAEWKEVEG